MTTQVKTKKKISVAKMTKIAILGALSFVLMIIEIPLPFFPDFLKIDASDLPALVGGFALGPVAGVLIVLIKNILHLPQTSSIYVGELANFVVGASLVLPASLLYYRTKTKKMAFLGLCIGIVTMAISGALMNLFVMLPLYTRLYGMPMEVLVSLGTKVNSNITDLTTFILYAIVPFNLIKGFVISTITLVIYKHISPILHKGL